MPDAADLGFMTMGELERIAEPKVPAHVWDYANGGSASEITLRRNRAALDRLAIEQRILVDVRQIDLSTEFLREQVPSPVMIAPMGSLGRFHPEGDLEMARGAGRKGGFSTVTGVCSWPMEQIAQEASGPLIFQLYFFGDRDWAAKRLERVQTCPQYKAVVLTVDTAVYSRRDRDLARRYSAPADRSGALEPLPPDRSYPARLTWDDFDWLREQVRLPLGIKGVLHPDDARRAIDHGADLIWVSNHGGRQLDGARATIDALPRIAEAVNGQASIVVDGGFTRGADVLKGLALGADIVALGKAAAWGLIAGGAVAIEHMLHILHEEIRIAMALSGNTSVRALTAANVCQVSY